MENLSIETILRIGLNFLDGDDLEYVLLDRSGHTDYDFARFYRLKRILTKIEEISQELDISAILWQAYPTNPQVGAPLVAGNSLPCEGCKRRYLNDRLRKTLSQGETSRLDREDGVFSCYAPVRNSDGDIVGALELLVGKTEKVDVSCRDMFVEPREEEDDE
ncbi:MAG: hypothetical protein ACOX64_00700 [Candidatus Merdivicinus sp.]|jgi:hypothetical protein